MDRLNNMHGEIKKIHQNKIAELRRKRIAAESFIRKNSRKFKKTRSARHEECHICLVQFENDAQVNLLQKPAYDEPTIHENIFLSVRQNDEIFRKYGAILIPIYYVI